MILAGDIGGTKTVLALFAGERELEHPVRRQRFVSAEYDSLEEVIAEFLAGSSEPPAAAGFGVAGPVAEGRVRITNLPWLIDAQSIVSAFDIPKVRLVNDLQAVATAVPHLRREDLSTINPGEPAPRGAIAVVAPGTGLGMAFLVWTPIGYRAYPTEGGHASFAPATAEQLELLSYLQHRFGHVSYERVCSGGGIPNLYDFLRSTGRHAEPDWLGQALSADRDPTPVIVNAGLGRKADVCVAVLDMFVRILGGVVGNIALKVLATGGIYLAGGIPPRILPRLLQPDFRAAIQNKGRFSTLLSNIPVHVIVDSDAPLRGAALHALQRDAEGPQ
jgi:glucokinase